MLKVKEVYLENLSPSLTYVENYEYKDMIFDIALFIKETGQLTDLIRVKPSFDLDSFLMMLSDLTKYRFYTNSLDVNGIYLVNEEANEVYSFNRNFFSVMSLSGLSVGYLELYEEDEDENDYQI